MASTEFWGAEKNRRQPYSISILRTFWPSPFGTHAWRILIGPRKVYNNLGKVNTTNSRNIAPGKIYPPKRIKYKLKGSLIPITLSTSQKEPLQASRDVAASNIKIRRIKRLDRRTYLIPMSKCCDCNKNSLQKVFKYIGKRKSFK